MPAAAPWAAALAEAEAKIASFDHVGLALAVAELHATMQRLLEDQTLSKQELLTARAALNDFCARCQYTKTQLAAALTAAAATSHTPARYARYRAALQPTHSLLRRTL